MVSESEMDRTLFTQQPTGLDNVGQRDIVHVFKEDLDKSNEKLDWLEELYKKVFPNYSFNCPYPNNMKKQKAGIDLDIFLHNGAVIAIDEKRREKNKKTGILYSDIALEYISNDRTGSPGWIEKDLCMDYLAYIFMPIKAMWLIPWLPLRMAWRQNGEQWKKIYRCFSSPNEGYKTWNVGVPVDILWRAIREASFFRLQR